MEEISTGAHESSIDPRTVKAESTLAFPLVKGGVDYLPAEIEHQHKVGVCTAISLVQNREKANGKKYSPDFQYLLQKKYYDNNWQEGSSIFNALKVGKNIGFLPSDLWTHTTEQDRYLPYAEYIAKLQAIPDLECLRLINLCVDKIPGYASVDVSDPQSIAKAIDESEAGILCRYNCGQEWWTPSWQPKDINPLKPPTNPTSGHAIIMNSFDYSVPLQQKLANTWGTLWCLQGCADINWANYKPTEAWTILKTAPVIKFLFTKTLSYGSKGEEVKQLQKKFGLKEDGLFGNNTLKAVVSFQTLNNLVADGICGKLTRAKLNS